jgi:hypothetical protein
MRFSLKHSRTGLPIVHSEATVLSLDVRPYNQWGQEETWGPNIFCTLDVRLTGFLAGFYEALFSPTNPKLVAITLERVTLFFHDAILSNLNTEILDGHVVYDTTWISREPDRVKSGFADRPVKELDWRRVGF